MPGVGIILSIHMRHQPDFARFIVPFEKPLVASISAFVIYLALSALRQSPFGVTQTAYFNYLADSFLHGQLHLRLLPPSLHDLSFFHGKYYLYWPPMPAVVLLPFVALFGVNFSDIFFTIVLASVNVGIVALLLRAATREQLIQSDEVLRALLVLFFAFGTVQITLALFGRVWFTAQQVGFLFVGLAYLVALQWKENSAFFVTGLLIACAMLTRNHLLFAGIWPAWHLLKKNWDRRPRPYVSFALFLLPLLFLGLLFLAYNYVRFESPFELGIRYHQMNPIFVADYQKYGAFHIHYLPINFFYQYVRYPFPLTEESLMGGSLFLLSPVFFYMFPGIISRYRSMDTWILLGSILAASVPILLLMGTGWIQFGPRYTFDFTVPLLLLTAQGAQLASKRILGVLVAISIVHYFIGAFLLIYLPT
jgi:hypothetical protein